MCGTHAQRPILAKNYNKKGEMMKIFDVILLLEHRENIVTCSKGHSYQRYNDNQIMVSFNRETLKGNTISSTIKNEDFLEQYIDEEFEQKLQWFQEGDLKLPRLCWVKESGWHDPKIVMINSRCGSMFNTGYGESYIATYHTTITPLTNEEIESLKR